MRCVQKRYVLALLMIDWPRPYPLSTTSDYPWAQVARIGREVNIYTTQPQPAERQLILDSIALSPKKG